MQKNRTKIGGVFFFMHEKTYARLIDAHDGFWWKFTITLVFSNPRSVWYEFVSKAFSVEAADHLDLFLKDEPESTESVTSVTDLMFFMDMHQLSHSCERNADKTSSETIQCRTCHRFFKTGDSLRKHYKKKHGLTHDKMKWKEMMLNQF